MKTKDAEGKKGRKNEKEQIYRDPIYIDLKSHRSSKSRIKIRV